MAQSGALTDGLVTLDRPPASLEILLERRCGTGNEFFQLLLRIRNQGQEKGSESDELNELLACQLGEAAWPDRRSPGPGIRGLQSRSLLCHAPAGDLRKAPNFLELLCPHL